RDALAEFGVGDPAAAVEAALEAATVIRFDEDLALARYAEAEGAIAESIARLVAPAQPIPAGTRRPPHPDATQRAPVRRALRSGVSVLTGGPGTGKSHTVAAIVSLAAKARKSVALAAPTGRAAKRLEELTGSPASTIHRLLGAQGRKRGDELEFAGGFARGAGTPPREEIVGGDETTMLDVQLARARLGGCAHGTPAVVLW